VQLACDIKTQITLGVPVTVIEKTCIVANGAVDTVQALRSGASDATESKVFGGLKASITALCELGKGVVGVANVVTKVNPLDAACLALSLYDSTRQMRSGQTLASQICQYFTSNQILPGVKTTDYLLRLVILDYASEDGDMVAIKLRGQEVFRGVVTNAPKSVPINLYPDFNHFEFIALNEGTSPPNTARVIIESLEGTNLGLTSYDLSVGQVATLDIIRTSN
jgi:hypothetical protein